MRVNIAVPPVKTLEGTVSPCPLHELRHCKGLTQPLLHERHTGGKRGMETKSIGVDSRGQTGGAARAHAQKIGKRPCIYHFLPYFPPNSGFPPIFLTSLLRQ